MKMRVKWAALFFALTGIAPIYAQAATAPAILPTVVVEGSFARWPHHQDWHGRIFMAPAQGREWDFPVASDGSFTVTLHDVPAGDGYDLEAARFGAQRFTIDADHVWIDVIDPDSAG